MPTIVTKFEVGQRVLYAGGEHVISAIDLTVRATHVVERYFLDDDRVNVDVIHLLIAEAPPPDRDSFVTHDDGSVYIDDLFVGHVESPDLDEKLCECMELFTLVVGEDTHMPSKTVIRLCDEFETQLSGRKLLKGGRFAREWCTPEFMASAKALYRHLRKCTKTDIGYFESRWGSWLS